MTQATRQKPNPTELPYYLQPNYKAYPLRSARAAEVDYLEYEKYFPGEWPLRNGGLPVGFRYQADNAEGGGNLGVMSNDEMAMVSKLAMILIIRSTTSVTGSSMH